MEVPYFILYLDNCPLLHLFIYLLNIVPESTRHYWMFCDKDVNYGMESQLQVGKLRIPYSTDEETTFS